MTKLYVFEPLFANFIEGNIGGVYVKFPKTWKGSEEAIAIINFFKNVKIKTDKEK
ncbi:MAG: hypothetical protein BTN85_1100 [Candidatus Methanohalarchaeum thermophilum]|uniref:Uncharacterized protein n=1 Tax=Methanohalarchaeum thermophilum TaxID=1903181 RepID=A0A1Q6DW76_METT1|nr:MAG: hypothetical protein BTN85_1100 [Candidatus Methanohalarchaeum thermophilum]